MGSLDSESSDANLMWVENKQSNNQKKMNDIDKREKFV